LQLPAYCDNCHLLFPSFIPMAPNVQARGNQQTCPQCGSLANIADFVNGVARLYPKDQFNQQLVTNSLAGINNKIDQLLVEFKNNNQSIQKNLDKIIQQDAGVKGFFGQLFHHSKKLKSVVRRIGWKKFIGLMAGSFMLVAGDDIADMVDFDLDIEPIIIQLPKPDVISKNKVGNFGDSRCNLDEDT